MTKAEVRALIQQEGIIPCVRVASKEDAQFAAETVNAAGIPIGVVAGSPIALAVLLSLFSGGGPVFRTPQPASR
jgi:hypothetical protein